MTYEELAQQIQALSQSVAQLRKVAAEGPLQQPALLAEALGELEARLEVLAAAQAEMRPQNEELVSAREALEAKRKLHEALHNITERNQAEEELQAREQQLSLLYNSVSDPMFSLSIEPDDRFRFISINPVFLTATGFTEDQVVGKLVQEVIPESAHALAIGGYIEAVREKKTVRWEEISTYPAGRKHGVVSVTPFFDAKGHCTRLIGTVHDITDRKRSGIPSALPEAHLRKLYRTHTPLSDVNQTIVRVRQPQELFEAACRIAVEQRGFRMAWIGLLDQQTKLVRPAAHAGETDGYLEKLNITLDDSGRGPIATSLRAGEHVVVNDIEGDPRMVPWRADALRLGYRASAFFPLMVSGEVRGMINLYAPEPDFFDDGELKLLDEMAADIAFALEFIEEDEKRQRAELLLRESEERYQTLARISPVGIFRTDPSGATTYVNPKWCNISGLSVNEALGVGWFDAVHPDDKEKVRRGWQESTQLQKASFSDYRFVRPDGTIAWVMGQAVPQMDSVNQVVGYVGTITDITERKRAEAALQASERQLSIIYANISDVLYYLAVEPDDCFRFLSVNPAFLKATGLTEDQVVGKLVQEVVPEPARALVLGNYKEAIRTKRVVRWQEVSEYPAGEKYGEVSIIPILDALGNCTRLVGTVHDITERVDAAIELRRLNAELEQRVALRTEELNAALQQAQEADRIKKNRPFSPPCRTNCAPRSTPSSALPA